MSVIVVSAHAIQKIEEHIIEMSPEIKEIRDLIVKLMKVKYPHYHSLMLRRS